MTAATGTEIVWTMHAARRVIQRNLDVEHILSIIARGLERGLWSRERRSLRMGKVRVVAVLKASGELVVITVCPSQTVRRRQKQ